MTTDDERQKLIDSMKTLERYNFEFRAMLSRMAELNYRANSWGGLITPEQQELISLGKQRHQKNIELKNEFGIRRFELETEIEKIRRQINQMDFQELFRPAEERQHERQRLNRGQDRER